MQERGAMRSIYLSNHAYVWMKERVGVGRKAAERLVFKAYEGGIGKDKAKGSLYRYIICETRRDCYRDTDIKIYGEMVYCFMNTPEGATVLVTVFTIPGSLKNQALGAQRKQAA